MVGGVRSILTVAVSVWRTFRAVRSGQTFVEEDFDILLNSRGFLARIFRPLFGMVTKSWHLFPIGFLFGFGFDTVQQTQRCVGYFGYFVGYARY